MSSRLLTHAVGLLAASLPAPAFAQAVFGSLSSPEVIAANIPIANGVFAADLDTDGDQDIIVSINPGGLGVGLLWYENDGDRPPSFTSHPVVTSAPDDREPFAIDFDGDGDIDIISARRNSGQIIWHRNDAGVGNPPAFTGIVVASGLNEPLSLVVDDFDNDGDLDIASTTRAGGTLRWHEYEPGGSSEFTTHIISIFVPFGAPVTWATSTAMVARICSSSRSTTTASCGSATPQARTDPLFSRTRSPTLSTARAPFSSSTSTTTVRTISRPAANSGTRSASSRSPARRRTPSWKPLSIQPP